MQVAGRFLFVRMTTGRAGLYNQAGSLAVCHMFLEGIVYIQVLLNQAGI